MIERAKNISDWDAKFYHCYSNGKRIKEISVETARKILTSKRKHKIKLVVVGKSWVSFRNGPAYVGLNRKQLKEVLEDGEKKP